jgi:hypothetical protein
MSHDHEICHTFLVLSLGYKWSPTLHCAAYRITHGERETTREESSKEEQIVLAIQKVINGILPTAHERGILEGIQVEWIVDRVLDARSRNDP